MNKSYLHIKEARTIGNRAKHSQETHMANWIPTSWAEVCRRAAGRSRYNAERRREQQERRKELARMVCGHDWYGCQSELAEYFEVHRSTICRDFQALKLQPCPYCSRPISQEADE